MLSTTWTNFGRPERDSSPSAASRSVASELLARPQRHGGNRHLVLGPGGRGSVGHRQVDRGQIAERIPHRAGEHRPGGGADHVGHAVDPPEVAVGVTAEQVAGLKPRVAGREHALQRHRAERLVGTHPGQQHAHVAGIAFPGEPVGAELQMLCVEVIARDPDLG